MAQQANVTVFDGAATPVSHTLKGDGITQDNGTITARWKEGIATVPDYAQVRLTQLRQKLRSGTQRCVTRFEVPVMESISGQNSSGYTAAPKVAYIDRFEMVSLSHPRSTPNSKKLCMQMLLNFCNNVSTTVTPIGSGVVAELHQDLVVVS